VYARFVRILALERVCRRDRLLVAPIERARLQKT